MECDGARLDFRPGMNVTINIPPYNLQSLWTNTKWFALVLRIFRDGRPPTGPRNTDIKLASAGILTAIGGVAIPAPGKSEAVGGSSTAQGKPRRARVETNTMYAPEQTWRRNNPPLFPKHAAPHLPAHTLVGRQRLNGTGGGV